MSSIAGGIAGRLDFKSYPVTQSESSALVTSAPHRAPAGYETIQVRSGVLVTLYLQSNARELISSVRTSDAGHTAVIHGDIHNIEEVLSSLGEENAPSGSSTEELLIAAYLKWGDSCPLYLIGDYAFAIWDAERNELFCARDAVGIKPFYYYPGEGLFLFGSEIDQVATCLEARRALDDAHILAFSQDRSDSREATFFSNIKRLPAAHCMRVSRDGIGQSRYWDPVNLVPLELDTLEEYVSEFEKLLKDAIRVRMPGPAEEVGVLLSGGVDSASVVAGIKQVRGEIATSDHLLALSLGFPGLACDESPTIRTNAELLGVDVHLHEHKPFTDSQVREAIAKTFGMPESVTAGAYGELFSYASSNHIKVVMGGWGADDWLGEWHGGYGDLLVAGQYRALSQLIRRDLSCSGLRSTIKTLFTECVRGPVARQIKRWVSACGLPLFAERASYVTEFDEAGWHSVSKWNQYRWLNSSMFAINCEMQELSAARRGIETRYPYNDRRIVEFGLRLPPQLFASSALSKPIIREFLARRVPAIATRMYSDPEGSPIYWQSLRKLYSDGDYDLSLLSQHFQLGSRWENGLSAPLDNPHYDARIMPYVVRQQWNSYTCGLWLDYFYHKNRDGTDYA